MQKGKREQLLSLLGDLPDMDRQVSARIIDVQDMGDYTLETLMLNLNGIEEAPAYFALPKNCTGRVPVMLYNHAHGGAYDIGKEELLFGRKALQKPYYAQLLTSMGFGALCFDTWCFGQRRGRTEGAMFKEMLWRGQVMWGMMVYDSIKAVDYLCARPEVDPSRILTMGLSMGSTMAWWLAALDTRVCACIDICCMTDFEEAIINGGINGHGIYYFVPRLLKYFETADINALIAPRPHLSLNGIYDDLTPARGLEKVDAAMKKLYDDMGAAENWSMINYPIGHYETAQMRGEIVSFLKRFV